MTKPMNSVIKNRQWHVTSGAERLRHWLLSQQWFSSILLPALPRKVRWALRWVYLAPIDLAERLFGRRDSMAPPRAHNCTGAVSDLEASRKALVDALVEVAGLTPSARVLDVGCGFGRLAAGLTGYLDAGGSYDGFDIVPEAVTWCATNISAPHGNIRFRRADIYNKEYNPRGRTKAVDYRFPFGDETFDVVVLVSIFTHMLPPEVDNYIGEIAQVLKPKGRCFATYLLLTPEARRLMSSPDSIMNFKHNLGSHWLVSTKVPELAVGYNENVVRELYAKHGLSWELYPGYWCGQASHWPRDSGIGEQDVVVARKP